MKKVLAIIPARGGSKGIPGKNIKKLAGKPLIAYTIEVAKKSKALDRIIVTTDDEKIAKIAKKYGAEVPFIRPGELATDTVPTLPVIQHAVNWLEDKEGYKPDYVIILQSTSPLRQPWHIKEAVDLIIEKQVDSVLSVALIPENYNPCNAMTIGDKGYLKLFNGQQIHKRIARRQDRPETFWSIGMIYLFKVNLLFQVEPNLYGQKVAPYVVEDKYLIDINEPDDWLQAEQALKNIV